MALLPCTWIERPPFSNWRGDSESSALGLAGRF